MLDIFNKAYKTFLKAHGEIEKESHTSLRKEIVNLIIACENDNRFVIGLYALVIIQETKGAIDTIFLHQEISKRVPKYPECTQDDITNILSDEFILKKLAER